MREDIGSEKNVSNTVPYHVTCKPYQPSMFVFYYLTASGFKHQGDPTSSPASTLPASDSQLETELARTHGIVTPKDKIRRGFSEPVLSNSREKGSLPSKLKKGHGRKKGKVKSKAVKKGGTGGGQTQPTAPPQPDSAPLPLPNGPPDIPAQSGTEPSAPPPPEPPVPGAQTEQPAAAPPNEGHPSPTGAPPSEPAVVPKPTAAKSMPAPKPTTAPVVPVKVKQEKAEDPATPGPPSVVRENRVQHAMQENLRRPDTRQQLESPAPTLTQAPPDAQPSPGSPSSLGDAFAYEEPAREGTSGAPKPAGTGGDTEKSGTEEVKVGGKKRREKTLQEKAAHARFMRFTRNIQSPSVSHLFSFVGFLHGLPICNMHSRF